MRGSLAIARQPLDSAELIPLSAAGRQPLFFFGTLTDLDVLAYVLERPIDVDDLQPATIAGFRRRCALGASYPLLVPEADGRVEGRLLRRATRRDIARINHFESEEYRAELHAVVNAGGPAHAAWLYLGLDHLAVSDEPWSLDAWQRSHKPGFFAACDGWMADFAEAD
jgi:Gamma-glutamyl cyclotransferase, AIG2-like